MKYIYKYIYIFLSLYMSISLDNTECLYALQCPMVWLCHGSTEVLEIDKLSPPNINKTGLCCTNKTVRKAGRCHKDRGLVSHLLPLCLTPTALLGSGRCCGRQRPFARTPWSLGLPTCTAFPHLAQNDKLIFFGDL